MREREREGVKKEKGGAKLEWFFAQTMHSTSMF